MSEPGFMSVPPEDDSFAYSVYQLTVAIYYLADILKQSKPKAK